MEIGFGIVGCGAISAAHIDAVENTPGAKLVAVADVMAERAEATAAAHACAAYDDYHRMLERTDIQAVCICTGSGIHMDPAVAAAQAGKHVVVEKPLEISLNRADAIIKACAQNNVKLTCIFQSRFSPAVMWAHEAAVSGRFGRVVLGDAYVKWYRSQEYYDQSNWRGTWRFDGGGALMNQSIHAVDTLQWCMGPVTAVQAYTACLAHERLEVEDTAAAVLHFQNGALGVIEGATSVNPGYPRRMEIHGTEGGCILVDDKLVELNGERFQADERAELLARLAAKESSSSFSDPMAFSFEGHRKQISNMVDSIRTGKELAVDGLAGRKAVEIIIAIYASALTGKQVELPLATDPAVIQAIHADLK